MDISTLRLSVTNCYLIQSSKGYLLIDTGYQYEWERFCRALKKVNIGIGEISHIILTHHHDDHCGLLNDILRENSRIRMVMSAKAVPLLRKGRNDHTNAGGYVTKRVSYLLSLKARFDKRWTHTFPPYETRNADILITKRTSLKELGLELDGEIIETPGHSIDSVSVVFNDGACIVGDAAANFLQFAGTKYCVIYVEDIEEYYRSWERLLSKGAKIIYPGHGKRFAAEELERNKGKISQKNIVKIS